MISVWFFFYYYYFFATFTHGAQTNEHLSVIIIYTFMLTYESEKGLIVSVHIKNHVSPIGKLTKPLIVSLCSLSCVFFGSHFVSPSSVEVQKDFYWKEKNRFLPSLQRQNLKGGGKGGPQQQCEKDRKGGWGSARGQRNGKLVVGGGFLLATWSEQGAKQGEIKGERSVVRTQLQEKDDYSRAWYQVCRPAVPANHAAGTLGQTAAWLHCANPTTYQTPHPTLLPPL